MKTGTVTKRSACRVPPYETESERRLALKIVGLFEGLTFAEAHNTLKVARVLLKRQAEDAMRKAAA